MLGGDYGGYRVVEELGLVLEIARDRGFSPRGLSTVHDENARALGRFGAVD